MAKIISVRTSVKEDRTLAVIRVEGKENPIFLTAKQVEAATGLSRNFSVLKGSDINVEFYKENDELVGGGKCTKADTLVKEFDIELAASVNNIATAAAFGASMF